MSTFPTTRSSHPDNTRWRDFRTRRMRLAARKLPLIGISACTQFGDALDLFSAGIEPDRNAYRLGFEFLCQLTDGQTRFVGGGQKFENGCLEGLAPTAPRPFRLEHYSVHGTATKAGYQTAYANTAGTRYYYGRMRCSTDDADDHETGEYHEENAQNGNPINYRSCHVTWRFYGLPSGTVLLIGILDHFITFQEPQPVIRLFRGAFEMKPTLPRFLMVVFPEYLFGRSWLGVRRTKITHRLWREQVMAPGVGETTGEPAMLPIPDTPQLNPDIGFRSFAFGCTLMDETSTSSLSRSGLRTSGRSSPASTSLNQSSALSRNFGYSWNSLSSMARCTAASFSTSHCTRRISRSESSALFRPSGAKTISTVPSEPPFDLFDWAASEVSLASFAGKAR